MNARTAPIGARRCRLLRPHEHGVVREVFAGMSPRSRYLRFHAPVPRLSDSMLRALTQVNDRTHVAVVVEIRAPDSWHPIAIGRLARIAPEVAEVSLAVVDAWQGRGVGRELIMDLRERASLLGVREIVASVLPGNEPVMQLLGSAFPGARIERDRDAVEVRAAVPALASPADPTWRPGRHGRRRPPPGGIRRQRRRRSRQRLPMA